MVFISRVFFCIFCAGLALYLYIDGLNELTELRLLIPQLEKQLHHGTEELARLQYEIDQFESPIHLMELLRHPEFRYLHHPEVKDIILLAPGAPLEPTQQ